MVATTECFVAENKLVKTFAPTGLTVQDTKILMKTLLYILKIARYEERLFPPHYLSFHYFPHINIQTDLCAASHGNRWSKEAMVSQ
jgi:hypothetical protein